MRTLFLNPNADESITAALRSRIAASIRPGTSYAVRCNEGAAALITCPAHNEQAARLMRARLPRWERDFDQLVLMSSLDTGYDLLRRSCSLRVQGFTRSVLAHCAKQGSELNLIFFGSDLIDAYLALLDASGHGAIRAQVRMLPLSPALARAEPQAAFDAAAAVCEQLRVDGHDHPSFILGVVGLGLSERLSRSGFRVVQPIEAMLAALGLSRTSGAVSFSGPSSHGW